MALAQHLAPQRQGLGKERLRLAVATLAPIQKRQVVHAGERVRVALAQHLAVSARAWA